MEMQTKGAKKSHLILVTLASALISVALGTLVVLMLRGYMMKYVRDEYKNQQAVAANSMASTVSDHVNDSVEKLKIIAQDPKVINYKDQSTCNKQVDKLLEVTGRRFNNLGRVDKNGNFVCSVNRQIIGEPTTKYGSYVQELIDDPQHQPVISKLLKGLSGVQSDAIAIHVPVYTESGQFDGTIGGAIYVQDMENKFFKEARLTKNSVLTLVDSNGQIIYHPDGSLRGKDYNDPEIINRYQPASVITDYVQKIPSTQSGTLEYSLDNNPRVGVYKNFSVSNNRHWSVIIAVPQSDIEAVIADAHLNTAIIIIIGALVISVTTVTFVTGRSLYKLVELDKAKDEFVSLASHQLRTPATAVKQYLGLIIDGITKDKDEERKFIKDAYDSNEQQLEIVEDILNIAKLDAGRVTLDKQSTNINELVENTVKQLQAVAEKRNQKLSLDMPDQQITASIDKIKMGMVFSNLISNAVKYTPEHGSIKVSVGDTKGQVEVRVSDNGPGIAPKDQTKLFTKFGRVQNKDTARVQGTGLGLYLAKNFVELHKGSITLQSELQKGTTFIVKLPKGGK